jgi:hypothetical protein
MYYPKSQVTTNLYSNNEFTVISTGEVYTGPYWKNSLGKYYTGTTPQDLPSLELSSIISFDNEPVILNSINTSAEVYDALIAPSYDKTIYEFSKQSTSENPTGLVPVYSPMTPTQQDYQAGEFRRYFCKKTNEVIYIEINKAQYDLLIVKSPEILWQLYFPFNIAWQLTGDKEQVARTNKNIVDLTSVRLQLPKFGDYINNNYIKYYR